MKRKRTSTEDLPPEELARRRMQKELQALALSLKSDGSVYKPQKHKRKVYKEHLVESGAPKPKKAPGAAKKGDKKGKSKHDTPKWRPYDNPDVVILPIYWNMHHEEKAVVMQAAERVAALMKEAGISSQVDAANQYTPGQKMKYWETAGVRVRVELGPKEAEAGTAVVARAGEPGTVAKKTTVNVAIQLVRELKAALAEEGWKPHQGGKQEEDDEEEEVGGRGQEQQGEGQGGAGAGEDGDTEHESVGTEGEGEEEDEEGKGTGAAAGSKVGKKGGGEPVKLSDKAEANREKKRARREKKKAAQKEAAGKNIVEGSRRDKRRKTKASLTGQPLGTTEGGGLAADAGGAEEQGPSMSEGEGPSDQPGAVGTQEARGGKRKAAAPGEGGGGGETTGGDMEAGTTAEEQAEGGKAKRGKTSEGKAAGARAGKAVGGVMEVDSVGVVGAVGGGGDDLADDFEIDASFLGEPEEDTLTLSKHQRMKKAKKDEKQRKRSSRFKDVASKGAWDAPKGGAEEQPAAGGAGKDSQGAGKAKKAKVVVF